MIKEKSFPRMAGESGQLCGEKEPSASLGTRNQIAPSIQQQSAVKLSLFSQTAEAIILSKVAKSHSERLRAVMRCLHFDLTCQHKRKYGKALVMG